MVVDIKKPVGADARNRSEDVLAVQAALERAAELTLDDKLDPGPVDGECGDGTEGAIAHLQRRLGMRAPDARIDPGGNTLARLNALLAIGEVEITFPFKRSSKHPFYGRKAGMRAFGSRRSGGKRAHAGIDLYFEDHTPVLAVAGGKLIRDPYPFYNDTWALEVDHGAFILRYGELAKEASWGLKKGSKVKRSQQLGRVGILLKGGKRMNLPSMMLHLEMYDKTQTGALSRAQGTSAKTRNGTTFKRRKDLIDPTGFLKRAKLPT